MLLDFADVIIKVPKQLTLTYGNHPLWAWLVQGTFKRECILPGKFRFQTAAESTIALPSLDLPFSTTYGEQLQHEPMGSILPELFPLQILDLFSQLPQVCKPIPYNKSLNIYLSNCLLYINLLLTPLLLINPNWYIIQAYYFRCLQGSQLMQGERNRSNTETSKTKNEIFKNYD